MTCWTLLSLWQRVVNQRCRNTSSEYSSSRDSHQLILSNQWGWSCQNGWGLAWQNTYTGKHKLYISCARCCAKLQTSISCLYVDILVHEYFIFHCIWNGLSYFRNHFIVVVINTITYILSLVSFVLLLIAVLFYRILNSFEQFILFWIDQHSYHCRQYDDARWHFYHRLVK